MGISPTSCTSIRTGRDHYHIVSVRVDENGRKIPDFRERVRSLEVLKELGPKYGFEVGRGKDLGEEVEPGEEKPRETNPYLGFNPEAGDFGNQIERIADLAMTYHFTEARHFEVIMESLGVKVGYQEKGISDSMYFIGLDPKTHKHCTAPISSAGIRYPDANTIDAHVKECKGKIKTREKQRLVNITHAALKDCMSELHFLRWMAKSGVYVAFSKTEKGKIYAVTFIDHHTKCCFKTAERHYAQIIRRSEAPCLEGYTPGAEVRPRRNQPGHRRFASFRSGQRAQPPS